MTIEEKMRKMDEEFEEFKELYKILNYGKADFNWIPCEESLPEGNDNEIPCLVTCSEWDIFDGYWGKKELRIISFITSTKTWNTKSASVVRVDAWMYLPDPYKTKYCPHCGAKMEE